MLDESYGMSFDLRMQSSSRSFYLGPPTRDISIGADALAPLWSVSVTYTIMCDFRACAMGMLDLKTASDKDVERLTLGSRLGNVKTVQEQSVPAILDARSSSQHLIFISSKRSALDKDPGASLPVTLFECFLQRIYSSPRPVLLKPIRHDSNNA